ncbi:complex I NDUFA9 subunit family protein [Lysobacter sp. BMK333-48F3]|uniref:complex I NDUFA9 subunit family protein n=1 Tax=Lysobacter sp. BMK333-48F3 TaxID=2867962 RepID=UPI001C8CA6D8|nr:complex I NDUFA9 subunit family protein [Lysobacter sp. BMK333-48F3]MBX9401430.1 complex I NDUFA9 subunit family protein [Lysobacter sp. BMK333-48F3]
MARRHVLVLGGTGFVGRHLVDHLLRERCRVTVLSRGVEPAKKRRLSRDASLIEGDVGNPDFLRAVLDDVDAVVNLVGILNERGDSGAGFEHVFVELLDALLEAMRDMGVKRLLQMSALNAGTGQSHYLESRGRAEQRVRASKLDWTLFRPSVIAGPGDGLFCRFDQLLRYAPALPIGRSGARFQPVWIGDVTQAFVNALNDGQHIGRSYNLVGPDVLSLGEIVRAAARARGRLRLVLPLPDALGKLQAEVGEHLPGKPISRDNWRSLQTDSTSVENGLLKLGVEPTPVLPKLPEILGLPPVGAA